MTQPTPSRTADTLGVIGLPAPMQELAARQWDAIIVGAGHNGLTCAAYLARAGQRVLVLEARERVGGACTLEETWPGYRVSPCAYVVGLLHPLVVKELKLAAYGFEWTPAVGGLFVPFDDGSSLQLWDDAARCEAEIEQFAPGDLPGWRAMHHLVERLSDAIRPAGADDMWLGPPPTRQMIEERVGGDPEALGLLFEWSMVELVERYLADERLQMAYLGQGVIGTLASPYHPGTASIYFHHVCGRLGQEPGIWGYVKGGMGMVSFIHTEILGPPDIEQKVGLTGGHIFQGECLPPYMWDRRLTARTPMPGLFLCGACTHPGGSVIAVNGRNAAMEILRA